MTTATIDTNETVAAMPDSLDLAAASVNTLKLPGVQIVAYTGGTMTVPMWNLIVIDLAGLELGTVPILADHESRRSGVIGHGQAMVQDGRLIVAGSVSATGEAAREVVEAARNGFPWQASVGVQVIEHEQVPAGRRIEVNGRTITAPPGGLTLVRKGKLREVSITSLGCDGGTAVAIAASQRNRERTSMTTDVANNIDEAAVRADERERLKRIEATCAGPKGGWGAQQERVDQLKASALSGEISESDLSAQMLTILRESRPKLNFGAMRPAQVVNHATALEAALLSRMGMTDLGEKTLGPLAMEHGAQLKANHALDLCRAALVYEGHEVPRGREEMVKASLSTTSLPVALGNLANKVLLDSYNEAPATWRSFCAVRSVSDFKKNTAIRPSFSTPLEPVAPGGEIKHGTVGEWLAEYQVDTFGKMLSIDRRDIVNDDLSVFDETARTLGRSAMRKISDLVYSVLLANAGSFFSAGNGNYFDGADSALTFDGLAKAITLMLVQRDDEGNDLDLRPRTLLVPPELQTAAKALLESEYLQQIAEKVPTGNSLRRAVSIEVEPRLSNDAKFGNQASDRHWYLFSSPAAVPMVVGFLQGQQSPTVEFFGLDHQPNRLAVTWRVYHDFGTALVDPRAAVRSKGEA
ncbi:MAG: Mu-like prophage major head subunit gpT family protein [Phycisphaeraceae bacterium]